MILLKHWQIIKEEFVDMKVRDSKGIIWSVEKEDDNYTLANEIGDILESYSLYELNNLDFSYVPEDLELNKLVTDTKVLARNVDSKIWRRRRFAKFENNKIYCFPCGCDAWASYNNTDWDMQEFDFIKLFEEKKDK